MDRNATYCFYKILINSNFLIFFLIYLLVSVTNNIFYFISEAFVTYFPNFQIKLQSESSIPKKGHPL